MNNEEKNYTPENESVEENTEASAVENNPGNKKLSGGIIAAIIAGAALVLAAVILAVVLLGGNQENPGNQEPEITYADYTVTVVDGLNNPVGNVIVTFKNESGESKMRVTETDGTATYKNALAGKYSVTVEQGYSEAIILKSQYELTEDITSLRVVVRDSSRTLDVYGDVPPSSFAYSVRDGSHSVICTANSSSYLVFNALQDGIYKVSFSSDDSGMTIGHYGNPMIAQSTHCGDLDYDGKSFELIIKDNTTPYLLGINATKDTVATLSIERIGNAPFDPSYDAEWIEIQSTATLTKCDLSDKTLVDLDISANDLSVSLNDDGYYYTNDGKLVYIRITTNTGHGYYEDEQFVPVLGGSLALIAGHVDQNVGGNIGGYVYDENGNFVHKLRYNEMIKTYMDYDDPKYGVVPLTAELAECIKLHGEFNGWWDTNGAAYLFKGMTVNSENTWLFLCMVEQ